MFPFVLICLAGAILLVGGVIFGHDHDGADHDHDHDHGGHEGHGHDNAHANEPTVSMFSMKVIGVFILGFGGGGAIASYYGVSKMGSSLWGLASGFAIALVMYVFMRILYGQQSDSLISTSSLVGTTGTVTTAINPNAVGKVDVVARGQAYTYLARSNGVEIKKGTHVRVVSTVGADLVVEPNQ